jgi:cob(I)alamin adenosyltransferase
MPRITRVYTRTGDDGTTALGGGQRVAKESLRVAVYGEVDELSSAIGVALAANPDEHFAATLRRIQNELFHLGSDLCFLEEDKARMPVPGIEARHVGMLEDLIDDLQEEVGALANFILPGGAPAAAHLHLARAVCRRAERTLVALSREATVGQYTVTYLNRLSDALFVMARCENQRQGQGDVLWDSRC